MDRFRLRGFNRLGFAALLANQVALVICAILGALLTPILSMISSVTFIWWLWTQTSWDRSSAPDDMRTMRIAQILLALPMLCGVASSYRAVSGTPAFLEWALHAANIGVTAIALLAGGFKNLWVSFGKSG